MTTLQLFLRFLKENGAYAEYKRFFGKWEPAWNRMGLPSEDLLMIRGCFLCDYKAMKHFIPSEWVQKAFPFDDTWSGIESWINMNNMWEFFFEFYQDACKEKKQKWKRKR